MYYDQNIANIREGVAGLRFKQNIDVNCLFLEKVFSHLRDNSIVLDLGTGNGFVLSEILRNSPYRLQLFGIDSSAEMVSHARQNLAGKADVILADNNDLPFIDCVIDVVTAKNVTTINANEIFRVLKSNGIFIFREYGRGKGLVEIAELFKDRIVRRRSPETYLGPLITAGFRKIKLVKHNIHREYECSEDLAKIAKSFPFIMDYSDDDERLIIEKFKDKPIITSDPFILTAEKK